jgi:hypothetical protein
MNRRANVHRAAVAVACMALAASACRLAGGAPESTSAAPSAAASGAGSVSQAPSLDPTPDGQLSSPDRPYGVDDILEAMAASRRPGGVPDVLQNRQVAASVAHAAWTWDGDPWETIAVSGSCGPEACSLELAGSASSGAGEDLYSFSVDPDARRVELVAADLHGYPSELEAELDAAARAALDAERLEGLALVGARWLPPPDRDRYLLAYRSGGEEGAPRLDVLLDLASGEVIDVTEGN